MRGRTQAHVAAFSAAAILLVALAPRAWAQTVPEGQSCGGLVCDLGIIGHKTERAPAPPPATPATSSPTARPLAETAPATRPRAPRRRLATKPVVRQPAVAARPAPKAAPTPAPVVAARPVEAPSRPVEAPARPVEAPARPPQAPARQVRAPAGPVRIPFAEPTVAREMPAPPPVYRRRPLIFQSIDPTLQ